MQTYVTIDGTTIVKNGHGHWVFAWSEAEQHSYKVVVDAVNPQDDKTFTGEQAACTPPPDSTTSTTTTTRVVETTTTAPETTATHPGPLAIEASTSTIEVSTPATPITQNLGTMPTALPSGRGGGSGGGGGSSGSGSGELPSTGPNDTAPFIAAGIAALAGGSTLVYLARRGSRGGTRS